MWPFAPAYPIKRLEDIVGQSYDYIVVGGGTAGSVIASRLSEDPTCSVLLVERGPLENSFQSMIPLASTANGSYAVKQKTAPEPHAGDRELEILAAETLGGNSRMNAMIYMRGTPAYYDKWAAEDGGEPDWAWDKVEPYFNKVEEKVSMRQTGDAQLESNIFSHLGKSAEAALGLPWVQRPNQPDAPAMGHFPLDLAIDPRGYRHSAWHAYLPKEVALKRQSHLHICCDTVVSRLDLDASSGGVVRGIFVQHAEAGEKGAASNSEATRSASPPLPPLFIKASREVIVTSGAIRTPQLLQLSGLGPRHLLESLNIPVVSDLPGVGSHLSDHNLFPVLVSAPAHETLQQMLDSIFSAIKHGLLYVALGKGWLKSTIDRALFINTLHLDDDNNTGTVEANEQTLDPHKTENIPDVELFIVPIGTLQELYPGKSLFTIQTCLTTPKSTGSVRIRSSNPHDKSEIRLNMLSDPDDRVVARKALRSSLHLAEHFVHRSGYPHPTSVFRGPGKEDDDSPEWQEGDWRSVSDESLDAYIQKHIISVYHFTSSCRMADRDQGGGVVDGQLRVHGFKNLRIADASVLPEIPPAHTMGPTYMVAERCADFVKEAWARGCEPRNSVTL